MELKVLVATLINILSTVICVVMYAKIRTAQEKKNPQAIQLQAELRGEERGLLIALETVHKAQIRYGKAVTGPIPDVEETLSALLATNQQLQGFRKS